MKKIAFFLLVSAMIGACSKKEIDVEYSNRLSGQPINGGGISPIPNPSPNPNPNPNPSPSNPTECRNIASANNFSENWENSVEHGENPSISACYSQENITGMGRWERRHRGLVSFSGFYAITLRNGQNTWIFRPFVFEQGKYRITLRVARETQSNSPKIQIKYGNEAKSSAMMSEIQSVMDITSNYVNTQQRGWTTIEKDIDFQAGTHFIGINVNSVNDNNTTLIDDFSIRKLNPSEVAGVNCSEETSISLNFDSGYFVKNSDTNPYNDISHQNKCWKTFVEQSWTAQPVGWDIAKTDTRPRFIAHSAKSGDFYLVATNKKCWMARPIKLEAGKNYKFSVWAKQIPASSSSNAYLEVSLATENSLNSLKNGQKIIPYKQISNRNYEEQTASFSVSQNGVYYIGIYGDAMNTANYLAIDDISLTNN